MSVRWSVMIGVMISAVVLFAGCERRVVTDERDTPSGLDPATISVPSGYASDAFEVAGGLTAWTRTKKMECDCVVTIYEPDGSFYLTQQHYDVDPWSNAIEISGQEPESRYVWRFSNGTMSVIQGIGQDRKLLADLECSCFAQAILAIATAPVRLLDPSAQFDRQDTAVKVSDNGITRSARPENALRKPSSIRTETACWSI